MTQIYVMLSDGSYQAQLTSDLGERCCLSWSPDGNKIAFVSWGEETLDLHVMNPNGSDGSITNSSWEIGFFFGTFLMSTTEWERELALRPEVAWSPDGRKLALPWVEDGNFEIYVINADGSGQTNLTNHPATDGVFSWSPDGSQLAFLSDRDGNKEIYVMNADGSGQTNLTNHPANDRFLSSSPWSPDGSKLAFLSDRDVTYDELYGLVGDEIYVMDADGSNQRRLTDLFTEDYRGKRVTSKSPPAWSPDGSKIAFASYPYPGELYVMSADGSNLTGVTDDLVGEWAWSPDSSKFAFCFGAGLAVIDADGSNPIRIDTACQLPIAWSPDGRKLAFVAYADVAHADLDWQLYVIDADGSDRTRLTCDSGVYPRDLAWSPGKVLDAGKPALCPQDPVLTPTPAAPPSEITHLGTRQFDSFRQDIKGVNPAERVRTTDEGALYMVGADRQGNQAEKVAIDGEGSLYVVRHVTGALPGQTRLGNSDAFLRKYDRDGNEVWTRQFGTEDSDVAFGVTVDSSGNVYVVGQVRGALPGQTASGGGDAYVRKYSIDGDEVWTRQFRTDGIDYLEWGVAVDGSGNVYVVGQVRGALPGQAASGPLFYAFVIKMHVSE